MSLRDKSGSDFNCVTKRHRGKDDWRRAKARVARTLGFRGTEL